MVELPKASSKRYAGIFNYDVSNEFVRDLHRAHMVPLGKLKCFSFPCELLELISVLPAFLPTKDRVNDLVFKGLRILGESCFVALLGAYW
jgi:hypothetical protein